MPSMIDNLYHGKLDFSATSFEDFHAQALLDVISQKEGQLLTRLKQKDRVAFQKYSQASEELLGLASLEKFRQGFALGCRLASETFDLDTKGK